MNKITFDRDELQERLLQVFVELFRLAEITDETPPHEARALAETAGKMYGRAYCACLHEGAIGHDVAFYLRSAEQYGKDVFMMSIGKRRPLKGL